MKSAEAALRNAPLQLDHSRQPSGPEILIKRTSVTAQKINHAARL